MKAIILILLTSTVSFGQYFAPSLTTIYQDNEKTAGQRYGLDMKYFALLPDHKELFLAGTYAYGESSTYDSDLLRFSIGCKTGDRLKYGAMASAIGYRTVNYPESTRDQYTASIAFSPLVSYDINRYFYIESGMSLTAFQMGDFEVNNSYFFSFGMRWW
jgi:hypothetical protein